MLLECCWQEDVTAWSLKMPVALWGFVTCALLTQGRNKNYI